MRAVLALMPLSFALSAPAAAAPHPAGGRVEAAGHRHAAAALREAGVSPQARRQIQAHAAAALPALRALEERVEGLALDLADWWTADALDPVEAEALRVEAVAVADAGSKLAVPLVVAAGAELSADERAALLDQARRAAARRLR
jgi:hypothetical protein